MTRNQVNTIIIDTLKPYDLSMIGLFGSYARNEAKEDSDIDILISFKHNKLSMFDLVGMQLDLEDKLHKKIDIVTERSINNNLKPYIESDLTIIYGNRA